MIWSKAGSYGDQHVRKIPRKTWALLFLFQVGSYVEVKGFWVGVENNIEVRTFAL